MSYHVHQVTLGDLQSFEIETRTNFATYSINGQDKQLNIIPGRWYEVVNKGEIILKTKEANKAILKYNNL
jgi:hypothetical protein